MGTASASPQAVPVSAALPEVVEEEEDDDLPDYGVEIRLDLTRDDGVVVSMTSPSALEIGQFYNEQSTSGEEASLTVTWSTPLQIAEQLDLLTSEELRAEGFQ